MRPYVGDGARVLDFDVENRPLSYLGQDFTTAEITAIAWAFTFPEERKKVKVEVALLGETDLESMLLRFRQVYIGSDIVTGHNILRHDLPMLNAMMLEQGMGPLPPILVSDTYAHLKRRHGVSGSQESLSEMLGVGRPKVGMSQVAWRQANRLEPEGIAKTRLRVVGDVLQHVEMRRRLIELGWLGPARRWAA